MTTYWHQSTFQAIVPRQKLRYPGLVSPPFWRLMTSILQLHHCWRLAKEMTMLECSSLFRLAEYWFKTTSIFHDPNDTFCCATFQFLGELFFYLQRFTPDGFDCLVWLWKSFSHSQIPDQGPICHFWRSFYRRGWRPIVPVGSNLSW